MINLTIFTDASHCPDTLAAAGAFWSRSAADKISNAFVLGRLRTSAEAELLTAVRAIQSCLIAAEYQELYQQKEPVLIILVVDCLFVKDVFEGRTTKSQWLQDVIDLKLQLANKGITLKINHVKGHTSCSKPRSWVNRWCDKMAGQEMRKYRRWLKGEIEETRNA